MWQPELVCHQRPSPTASGQADGYTYQQTNRDNRRSLPCDHTDDLMAYEAHGPEYGDITPAVAGRNGNRVSDCDQGDQSDEERQ